MHFEPKKLYYRIGEVCRIVGVEAYVLRYWESQFPTLRPPKNKAGRRTYRPGDIELLLRIRELLYEEGFTISGARKQILRDRRDVAEPKASRKAVTPPAEREETGTTENISRLRRELENMLTFLDRE